MKRPEFVKIKLTSEWMGNNIGSIMTILRFKADELIKRGIAFIPDSEIKNIEIKAKSIESAPMNKMIESAPVNKVGRKKKDK